jgi:glucose/arabinose dehydrogenase
MMKRLALFVIGIIALSACQPIVPSPSPASTNTIQNPTATRAVSPTPQLITTTPTATQPPAVFKPEVALQQIASGFSAPVALAAPDDGSGRLFIVDQVGLIYIIDSNDTLLDTPFLDLHSKIVSLDGNYDERGLLGLAFHPDYANNNRFFVYYSAPSKGILPLGWNHTSVITEFAVSADDPNLADPNSEKIIMQVNEPQANHNSGAISFGPDGYLYIPLGDGGNADDVGIGHAKDWYDTNKGGNGQDLESNPLGSILRIDIDNGDPYSVPADNPALSANYPETWAYGFRNPYRIAFDPGGTHELFVGDVGQDLWEEVSIVTAGGNYGWNVKEGTHCFSTADPDTPDTITSCPSEDPQSQPLIDPIIEFANSDNPQGGLGAAVIGGVVYRGQMFPAWDGKYIFGQWSLSGRAPQGSLFVATRPTGDVSGMWDFQPVQIAGRNDSVLGEYLLGFGQDTSGEVYVLTSGLAGPSGSTGIVYRIVPPQ